MRNRLLSSVIFAALAGLPAAPAFAASSASATVSIISVQLFDLDGGDGITPGITWNNASIAKSFAQASVSHEAAPALDSAASGGGSLPFGALARQASSAYGQAQASIAGGNGINPLSGTVLRAAGSATGSSAPGGGPYTSFAAQAIAPDAFYAGGSQFTLTANTIAVFRASVSVTASAANGAGGDAYAEATGFLRVLGTGPTDTSGSILPCGCGAGVQNLVDSMSVAAQSGQTFSNAGTLLVTFTNATGADKLGFLGAKALVLGNSSIAPVPEPAEWALLLTGLGMVGWAARRRRAER